MAHTTLNREVARTPAVSSKLFSAGFASATASAAYVRFACTEHFPAALHLEARHFEEPHFEEPQFEAPEAHAPEVQAIEPMRIGPPHAAPAFFIAIAIGAMLMRAIQDAIDIIIRAGAAIGQQADIFIMYLLPSRPMPDRSCILLFTHLDAKQNQVV
ncbi:MAG: hypothetical protein ABL995_09700 [Bryobacteraceae bacterium]